MAKGTLVSLEMCIRCNVNFGSKTMNFELLKIKIQFSFKDRAYTHLEMNAIG